MLCKAGSPESKKLARNEDSGNNIPESSFFSGARNHAALAFQKRTRLLFVYRFGKRARPDHKLGRRAELSGPQLYARRHEEGGFGILAGIVEIVREGHPDITAQDPEAGHFDPKATPGDPRWYMVDVKLVRRFEPPVPRSLLRFVPELAGMELMKTGSRLSVQPVEAEAYAAIVRLADQLAADKAAGQEVKA